MKKTDKKYFGIYLNNKIPKLENKENKYYYSIKPKFEGQAFILDDNKTDIKEELENDKKFNKKGKHIIKFINKENQVYYINIKIIKLWIIWLFLFAFLFLLGLTILLPNNDPKSNYIIQEVVSYDMEMEGLKYVFDINYRNNEFQNIELTDKVSSQKMIYPGSFGSLYIVISTKNGNKDMLYKMNIIEETSKPKNLNFEVNGKVYNSFTELAKDINGKILKDDIKTLKINWFWNYETNDDIIDTMDGMNFKNYRVLMTMIGTEGG